MIMGNMVLHLKKDEEKEIEELADQLDVEPRELVKYLILGLIYELKEDVGYERSNQII